MIAGVPVRSNVVCRVVRVVLFYAGFCGNLGGDRGRIVDLRKLKSVMELFAASDIAEMKISSGDETVHLIRRAAASAQQPGGTVAPVLPPVAAEYPAENDAAGEEENGVVVKAPMVGTFYRAASPERPPFVQIGQRVEEGQTLCIIEAMKLMNEIPAPASGVVRSIAAENGQPVSYGDRLMIIE